MRPYFSQCKRYFRLERFSKLCIMRPMNHVAEIVNRWPEPSVNTFAQDIGESYGLVHVWIHRNSIPKRSWPAILRAAKTRRLGLSVNDLLPEMVNGG